mgnify:FL=1
MFRELGTTEVAKEFQPIDVFADNLDVSKDYETVFDGHVEMERGQAWLATDTLHYNHRTKLYRTDGLVKFQNESLRMTAESA